MSVYYKGTKFTAQGVDDYEQLQNKPSINGIPLSGNVNVGAIQEVSTLPTLPDGKTLYKVGEKLRWWNGVKWASVNAITDWASTETLPPNPDPLTIYKFGDGLGWFNGSEWRPIDKDQVSMKLNGSYTTVTEDNVNIYAPTSAGTSGQILKSNGTYSAPTWINAPSGKLTFNGSETTVDTSLSLYAPTTAGTSGQVLTSTGGGAPTWQNAATGGQDSWYGTCDTAANTAAKVVTCAGFTLTKGCTITVKFAASNSKDTPTLNVNNTGDKQIYINGATMKADRCWGDGDYVQFTYNGSQWILNSLGEPTCLYGSCGTAAATAKKEVAIAGFHLRPGVRISITFTYNHNSTSNATLNVNSTGDKTIYYRGSTVTFQNSWFAGEYMEMVYDGTYWRIVGMMGDNTPVGTMIASFSTNTPTGYIFCNGGAINRTTYSRLYSAIGTSFGAGDGSTTFNVPNMNTKFLEGTTSSGYIRGSADPGIPDIYGYYEPYQSTVSGTFTTSAVNRGGAMYSNYTTRKDGYYAGTENKTVNSGFYFRASKGEVPSTSSTSVSNKVYGKSSTVQPNSYRCYWYIKY